jgi:hypothetical protein
MSSLYFQLDTETADERALLTARVRDILDSTPLESDRQFTTAVNEWLARAAAVGSGGSRRRATALAIAESSIVPAMSRNDIFKRPDVVSRTTFYNRDKDWIHHPEYRLALEVLCGLYQRWDAAREAREMMQRQAEWREKTYKRANDLLEVGDTTRIMLLDGMLSHLNPADITWTNISQLIAAVSRTSLDADKLARLALGMDTEQTAVAVTAEVSEVNHSELEQTMRRRLAALGAAFNHAPQPEEAEETDEPDEQAE